MKMIRTEVGLLLEKEGWERVVPTLQLINTPAILSPLAPSRVSLGQFILPTEGSCQQD